LKLAALSADMALQQPPRSGAVALGNRLQVFARFVHAVLGIIGLRE